jgi:hypothetical protein
MRALQPAGSTTILPSPPANSGRVANNGGGGNTVPERHIGLNRAILYFAIGAAALVLMVILIKRQ